MAKRADILNHNVNLRKLSYYDEDGVFAEVPKEMISRMKERFAHTFFLEGYRGCSWGGQCAN